LVGRGICTQGAYRYNTFKEVQIARCNETVVRQYNH